MHVLVNLLRRQGTLLALGAGLVLCVIAWSAEQRLAGEWGFPLDDTWIHCQIARNLVQGHGWSYNPGVPVQNSSGPLWTALVAVGFVLPGSDVWAVKVLGALCFLACIVMAATLALAWSGDRNAAALAALLAATSVPLAWHGLSGMETALAALLVGATLAAFQRWTSGRRRFVWPVLAALAVTARPETLLLVPLLALEIWRRHGAAARRTAAREVALTAALAAVVLLPYFILNLRLSGSLFPTTFAAKAGPTGLASALRHGDLLEMVLSCSLYPYAWTVHALSYFARLNLGVLLAAALGAWTAARGAPGILAPGLLLLGLPALRGVAAPHNLPEFQEGRYIGSLLPVLYACAGIGLLALWRDVTHRQQTRRLQTLALISLVITAAAWARLELRVPHVGPGLLQALPGLLRGGRIEAGIDGNLQLERLGLLTALLVPLFLLACGRLRSGRLLAPLLLLLTLGIQSWRLPRLPPNYAGNVRDIQAMDVALGRWVQRNVPQGTRLAVNDIGAIAYFGERPLVDVIGLATPELASYWSPRHLRTLAALRRLSPELCIIFPNWFPEWTSRPSLLRPVLQNEVPNMSILGGAVAIVYRLDWERFSRFYDDALLARLDPPEAYASFAAHRRRGMRNLALATRGRLQANAGDYLLEHGDPRGAERHYRRATELEPQEMAGWRGLLELYHTQQRREELGRAVQEMLRQIPEAPGPLEALAQWLDASGRHDEARSAYERALSLHPDNVRLLTKLERSLAAQGNEAEAASYRARRLELESPPPALLQAGRAVSPVGSARR